MTGPAIPDILLSLVGLYFIVISLKKKLFSFYSNYFLISITFYFCLLLSSLLSDYPLLSMTQGGSIFILDIFFLYWLFGLLECNKN